MADLIFLLITAAFFALSVGYVVLCDRIIGPDPAPDTGAERSLDAESVRS